MFIIIKPVCYNSSSRDTLRNILSEEFPADVKFISDIVAVYLCYVQERYFSYQKIKNKKQ